MLREGKRNESRISRSSGLEPCHGALKLAQERIASSPIYWQEFGYLVSTLDMNSWRWQINGSIISAVCHRCDSKCYSNEAVIIGKLRGSILSKGRVQGKRWRGDYRTRGQSLRTKGYSAYLKHLLEARLPIHHALNNPSQLQQRQTESSHQSSTLKIIREVYSPVHPSATKTCSCDLHGCWWGTSHSRVILAAPQPQARAQLGFTSQTQKCSGAPTHTTNLQILSMAGHTWGTVSCTNQHDALFQQAFQQFWYCLHIHRQW